MTDKASEVLAEYGILLRHVRLDDMDLAYGEFEGRTGTLHWFVGVDDGGVACAMPFAEGPLWIDEGEGAAAFISRGSIVGHGDRILSATSDLDARSMVSGLFAHGVRIRKEAVGRVISAIEHTVAPVVERIGCRNDLLKAFDKERAGRLEHPDLDTNLVDRRNSTLTVTIPEAESLLRFSGRDGLLIPALGIRGLDLMQSPEVLRAEALRSLGVVEATVRRVVGPTRVTLRAARLLSVVPTDWVPEPGDGRAWDAFGTVAFLLESTRFPVSEWGELVRASKGKWEPYLDRLRGVAPPMEIQGIDVDLNLAVDAGQTRDLVNGFHAFLEGLAGTDGVGRSAKAYDLAMEALVGGRGLVSLMEASRIWHERFDETAPKGVTWDPILPGWTHGGTGIEVVVLRSSDDLIDEGSRATGMGHCVGSASYVRDCFRNRTRILSLRRDGRRLSTVELFLDGPAGRVLLVQHRGPRNVVPSKEAEVVLDEYLDLASVARSVAGTVETDADLPVDDAAISEARLRAWRPYLTGRWRNVPIEEFRELVAQGLGPTAPGP